MSRYFAAGYFQARYFEGDFFVVTDSTPEPAAAAAAAPDYKPKRKRYWFEQDGVRISASSVAELQAKLDRLPDAPASATIAEPPRRRRSLVVEADFEPLPELDIAIEALLPDEGPGDTVDFDALLAVVRERLRQRRRKAAAILLLHN